MIDIFHFFQEYFELRMSGKTGIEKDNLFKTFIPRSAHFHHNAFKGKSPETARLLVIIAVGTPVDTTSHGLQPQDVLKMTIQLPGEKRRRPTIKRGMRKPLPTEMPFPVFFPQENPRNSRNLRMRSE
jgi:hypothetical protein